jgi:hypothetical protein
MPDKWGIRFSYLILAISLLMVIAYSIGYQMVTEEMPVSWSHETDSPAFRLEDSIQWKCATDGTIQVNGNEYWCTDYGIELERGLQ